MPDFADIFLKIMYEKIIETTILKLSIGTTAPVRSSCKTFNSRVMNSLLRHMKGRYRRIYFWHLFTADGFPFAKISNLAIISNAYAYGCSEI